MGMATLYVTPDNWKEIEYRRATLKAARKQARTNRIQVFIRVGKRRSSYVVARVDGRFINSVLTSWRFKPVVTGLTQPNNESD